MSAFPNSSSRRRSCHTASYALVPALVVTGLVLLFAAGPAAAEADDPPVDYIAPIVAPVVDPFRPPTSPYGPGNRGIEYATVPGSTVVAAADGFVTFAGQVAGSLHVTVQHPDGVRVTASFLASVLVTAGAPVAQGEVIGTTGARLHVSARRGDVYFDPASLWGSGAAHVYLIPLAERPVRRSHWGSRWWSGYARPSAQHRRRAAQPHSPGPTLGRQPAPGPGFVEP